MHIQISLSNTRPFLLVYVNQRTVVSFAYESSTFFIFILPHFP